MAEGSGTNSPGGATDITRRRKSNNPRLSPSRESAETGGSGSSSPRVSRERLAGAMEDSSTETMSDGEKRKMMKDKKGGFFGVSNLVNIFSASHQTKNQEMHKIFSSLPSSEKLVDDYSCALQRDILIHGRLYVTQNWLCFYANIFSWETLITIPFKSVRAITKEKTALVIPNAIQVSVSSDKYGFSSLVNRDVTYTVIFKCWQNNLLDQPMTPLELVRASRKAHGESTDVGSEVDLWGQEKKPRSSSMNLTKQVSLPTYVEIGRIPATSSSGSLLSSSIPDNLGRLPANSSTTSVLSTSSPDIGTSLPVGVGTACPPRHVSAPDCLNGDVLTNGMNEEGVHRLANGRVGNQESEAFHVATPSSSEGRTVVPIDYMDRGSGGESGSAEYETVSLIEDTGEVPCDCSEHLGRTMLNDEYSTDVETLFRLIFTDSDFFRNFNKAEKTINVKIGEWQVQSDNSRLRDLSYTLALNYSFGPKFTHTTEHQVYSKSCQPGLKHIVDTEVVNHNIPYGDTFYTTCRYCITRVAHKKTRLRVTVNIKFKKSCWGLVKNLIERNAGDGLRTHYTHLDTVLKEHVSSLQEKQTRAHRRASRPSVSSRRHKRQPAPNRAASYPPISSAYEVDNSSDAFTPSGAVVRSASESRPPSSSGLLAEKSGDEDAVKEKSRKSKSDKSLPRVNLALTLLLGILIVSNMMLYHHLMSYSPDVTTPISPPLSKSPSEDEAGQEWPSSADHWQELLQQKLASRSLETGKLKEALFSFIQNLENIEKSINSAKIELLSTLSNWDPDILVQRQHGTEGGGAKREAGRGVARQEVGGGRAKGDPAGGGGAKRHRSQEL